MALLLAAGIVLASAPQKSYAADTPDNYTAQIAVSGYGTITVELNRKAAPITVDNFVKLARSGFYNGLTFHRVINGFMIQGGDPKGDGTGGSADTIKGEFSNNGWNNPILHTRGVISMARGNNPDSASSQFFIVHRDTADLNGNYAAFGHVVSGMNVVDSIANIPVMSVPVDVDENGKIKYEYSLPMTKPVITSIKITDGVSSNGWQKSGSRWLYKYDSVTAKTMGKAYPANEKILIDGKWYYFDGSGYMKTGWQKLDGKWYYLDNNSGQMKTGWLKSGNVWYYLNTDGTMVDNARQAIGGKTYIFASGGAMRTGWVSQSGKWYYCDGSGAMKTGWLKSGNVWYYLNGDGTMVDNDKQDVAGKTYFFAKGGAMKTGWVKQGGKWYYCDGSGAMKTGWLKSGNVWYYLNGDGTMVDNDKQDVAGKTYFFASGGAMRTGWVKQGNDWYYCNSSGAMKTGWQKVGGKWYFLEDGTEDPKTASKGVMLTGWISLDKQVYCLDKSGAMITGWFDDNGIWYYFNGSGLLQTNKWIGNTYWVGEDGKMAVNSWVDDDRYYVDANGKYVKNKVR